MKLLAQLNFGNIEAEIIKDHPELGPGRRGAIFLFGDQTNVSMIINRVIPYVFVIAGLILLFMLVMGGIGMMLGANNENSVKKAQGQITNALLGFLLLFIAYWIVQIVGVVLGITIF